MIEAQTLKRMIRAMNSILNLYDEKEIPEEIVDRLMTGILAVETYLNIPKEYDEKTGMLLKYVMPVNFGDWIKGLGENKLAK